MLPVRINGQSRAVLHFKRCYLEYRWTKQGVSFLQWIVPVGEMDGVGVVLDVQQGLLVSLPLLCVVVVVGTCTDCAHHQTGCQG